MFAEPRLLGAALQFPRRRPQPGRFDNGAGELPMPLRRWTGCRPSTARRKICWIAGVSFGAWIAMQLLMRRPEIDGFISVAPPAKHYDFSFLAPCPASGLFVNGEKDTVTPPEAGAELVGQAQDAEGHHDRAQGDSRRQPLLPGQDRGADQDLLGPISTSGCAGGQAELVGALPQCSAFGSRHGLPVSGCGAPVVPGKVIGRPLQRAHGEIGPGLGLHRIAVQARRFGRHDTAACTRLAQIIASASGCAGRRRR